MLWLELFCPRKPQPTFGKQPPCMYPSCKKTRNDSGSCCSVIEQKKRFSGTNQKPELLRPFETGPSSPSWLFLTRIFFFSPVWISSPPPLTAPGSPRMPRAQLSYAVLNYECGCHVRAVNAMYEWQGWKWIEIWKSWPVFSSFDTTSSKNPQEIYYG